MHKAKQQSRRSASKNSRVIVSKERVKCIGDGIKLAEKRKWELAPFLAVVMNLPFIEELNNDTLIIDSKDAPQTIGLHVLDRDTGIITSVLEDRDSRCRVERGNVKWHEKIYITLSAAEAIKNGEPIAVEVDSNGNIMPGLVVYSFALNARVVRIVCSKTYDGITIPLIFGALRS